MSRHLTHSCRIPWCLSFCLSFLMLLPILFFFHQSALAAQVTLAWDPNNEPDLAGYRVHYGTVSGNYQIHLDAGLNTTYTIANLQDGKAYFLAITAYDSFGNESSFSNEVFYAVNAFWDVAFGYWAEDFISAIYHAGITAGCSQSPLMYCPGKEVTREEMAAFIIRTIEAAPPANYCESGVPFIDVTANMWSCRFIKRLKELGVAGEYPDGRYGPYDLVSREQMAEFLVMAGEESPAVDYCDSGNPFVDVTADMWSCGYIKRLKELGITTGYGDGRYGPYDAVTRAQMAVFLARSFLGM